jgi:hypothetical protein
MARWIRPPGGISNVEVWLDGSPVPYPLQASERKGYVIVVKCDADGEPITDGWEDLPHDEIETEVLRGYVELVRCLNYDWD